MLFISELEHAIEIVALILKIKCVISVWDLEKSTQSALWVNASGCKHCKNVKNNLNVNS